MKITTIISFFYLLLLLSFLLVSCTPTVDEVKTLKNFPGLLELATSVDYKIREAVAQNALTTPEILQELADDTYYQVRSAVGENPHTPAVFLLELAKDRDFQVRAGVARNRKTFKNILEVLAKDSFAAVRLEVARNPHTPLSGLQLLVEDSQSSVRSCLTLNTALSLELQLLLALDISRWSSPYNDNFQHVCQGLITNEFIDKSVLDIVALSHDYRLHLKQYWQKEGLLEASNQLDDYGNNYPNKEKSWRSWDANKANLALSRKQTINRLKTTLELLVQIHPDFLLLKKKLFSFKVKNSP